MGSQIWANNCHKLIRRRSTSPDYSAPNHNEQPPNDRPPAPHITRIYDPDLIGAFEAERPKVVPYAGRFDGFHAVQASLVAYRSVAVRCGWGQNNLGSCCDG